MLVGLILEALSSATAATAYAQELQASPGTNVSREAILQRLADPESIGFKVNAARKGLDALLFRPGKRMLWKNEESGQTIS